VLYSRESFAFIANEGIYGLSSVWSTGGDVATSLYNAKNDKKAVAFRGRMGKYLPYLEYSFEYTNPNVGCTKRHWVEVNLDLSDQQAKDIGWTYGTESSREFLVTGKITEIAVKPAETSCDNGKVQIKLEADKVYDVAQSRCLIK
jgi:hypothetical protein